MYNNYLAKTDNILLGIAYHTVSLFLANTDIHNEEEHLTTCILKKYLLVLKEAYIVYILKKCTFLKILFLEKGVLFSALPILKPAWRRKGTLFQKSHIAYYIPKRSLCGNLIVWLLYKYNFPHE